MRIAIPVWGNRISPVLDVAREISLFDLERGQVQNEISITLDNESLPDRTIKLSENGVDQVLCGAVSEVFYQILTNQDIKVLPWLTGKTDDVLQAFISGQINKSCFQMPGCRGQTQRKRQRRGRKSRQLRTNEDKKMKVVITANGTTLDAEIDPRFGRARYFLLIDPETKEIVVHDNQQNQQAAGGAGIQAAEIIANAGAEVLLTGHCGPKAFRALEAAGIKIIIDAEGTVNEVINKFRKGKYEYASSADVESHW